MYNIDKLEQQWIRYRRKKMLFPFLLFLLSAGIVGGAIYFSKLDRSILNSGIDNDTIAVNKDINKTKPIVKKTKPPQKAAKRNNLAVEVPSLGINRTEYPEADRPKVGQIIFQDSVKKPQKKVRKRKNLLIQVTERGSKDIAVDIENRFEFAKDKSDSLFLAKYYYDKMEYAKAEKWSLETNKLDNTIEESWLIFAKAQAKQGKRIESLKVLRAFFDQTGSAKAKILIDKIRRGRSF